MFRRTKAAFEAETNADQSQDQNNQIADSNDLDHLPQDIANFSKNTGVNMTENTNTAAAINAATSNNSSANVASAAAFRPDLSRRVVDMPGNNANTGRWAPDAAANKTGKEVEAQRLMVGKGITLNGAIAACDFLTVEGSVEATLKDSRAVYIAESGQFKGTAEIETAEIAGQFDGELTVSQKLIIRATGRVSGKVRYHQIEIECGGRLTGDVQAIESATTSAKVEPLKIADAK